MKCDLSWNIISDDEISDDEISDDEISGDRFYGKSSNTLVITRSSRIFSLNPFPENTQKLIVTIEVHNAEYYSFQ